MTAQQETMCTMLVQFDGNSPAQKELKESLEKGNNEVKTDTMKKVIMLHQNGEPQAGLLMTFIRFVLPCEDHTLKKLSLYFLEIVDKTDSSGALLPEMLLVCNFIRNDLHHPNEYIRGCTLRFVCKLKEEELLEPLAEPIISNLDYRYPYVRRNAVLAVFSVYQRFPKLIPDAPEIVETFLDTESDLSAKRNAFIMLFNTAQERAVRYLRKVIETTEIETSGDIFQLALVDLLKHLCKNNPQEKTQYLRVIFTLLSSKSPAVLFQCATTLLNMSSSPIPIKEAASTFVNLLNTHGDNNVKLIVLDRLEEIRQKYPEILSDLLMDLLRTLASPNMDIRKKILDLALDLVTERNVEKVMQFLKKEAVKTQIDTDGDRAQNQEYRQMLVRSIHQCSVKHPSVGPTIVPVLLDYIIEPNASAVDVILFIREIVEKMDTLREDVLKRLASTFGSIASARVLRTALWIFGTHCRSVAECMHIFDIIKQSVGPYPLVPTEKLSSSPTGGKGEGAGGEDGQEDSSSTPITGTTTTRTTSGTAVRADGTYVTTLEETTTVDTTNDMPFRTHLLNGDFFLASALSSTVTKLAITVNNLDDAPANVKKSVKVDAAELMSELLKMGNNASPPIDNDSYERISLCVQLLQNSDSPACQALVEASKSAFAEMIQETAAESTTDKDAQHERRFVPVDSTIQFTQLASHVARHKGRGMDLDGAVEDVTIATSNQSLNKNSDFVSQLNKVMQLTGFSDPVYCEATITVHQFDILLDLLIINQTGSTMQNLTVELATVGDLKLCERPQSYTLGPYEQISIKANIKVSSTETGIIFGNIVYDLTSAANERNCVILNDIHIDIMDYISPATCPATQFRAMWAEFEWENKVAVNTDIKSLREYLDHILKNTNMKCLTNDSSLGGDCDFLSANLYAKSSFGEDALANISIERQPDGKIEGFVRIRSKTQGIALSLGDKITMKQKG